jgi:putative spermidine/putrescine transport system ATP-binding protein
MSVTIHKTRTLHPSEASAVEHVDDSPVERAARAVLDDSRGLGGGISMRHVDKIYAGSAAKALDDFSLDVKPGEMVVLLGGSGCGKSTALRSLAGLEDIQAGRIFVGGRDVTGVPVNRRNMAMVFQAYSLFPHMTALQNIEFGLEAHGVSRSRRRTLAMEKLDLVGLADQAGKYTQRMSGGQQQRVALARALAVSPKVLLLDEPLSALDAKVRVQLREEIRRIQRETGTTTVFVTHDQEEALAIADRIGVMNRGRVEQIAAPRTLYQRPATEYVATFVGVTNRLPCVVDHGEAIVFGSRVPLLSGSAPDGNASVLVRPESLGLTFEADDAQPWSRPSGSSVAEPVCGDGTIGMSVSGLPAEAGVPGVVRAVHFLGAVVRVSVRVRAQQDADVCRDVVVQTSAHLLPPRVPIGGRVVVGAFPVPALAVR